MRLPPSSSLLLASLAVSLSSSSSLSALAAPAADLPEDSSSPKPGAVAPCTGSDNGAPQARSFDLLQGRVDIPGLGSIVKLPRDSESGAAGNSTSPDPNTAPAPAAAPPSTPAGSPQAPEAPVKPPKPPVEPPVKPPVQLPVSK